jgi:tetratricopeptide (TPR) repeat protein
MKEQKMTGKQCNAEIAENAANAEFCGGAKAGAVTASDKAENPRVRKHIDNADELYEKKEYTKAVNEYIRALEIEPENTYALLGRGVACYSNGEYGKARTDFQKVLRFAEAKNDASGMADAYIDLAYTYYSEAQYDQATAFFEKAFALDDKKARYYQNCGTAYYQAGEYGKARTKFTEAARFAEAKNDTSGMAQAYDLVGNTYYSEANYDKAIAFFEKAIALDDKKALIFCNAVIFKRAAKRPPSR